MPNLCQPQGVTQTIQLATAPTTGFYPVAFLEDGQMTIPNFVQIIGAGNTGTADLLINDGLLRTHQDSMVFAINNTGGNDLTLTLYIAKQPITDLAKAKATPKDFMLATYPLTIKADATQHLELRRIDGEYIMSHQKSNVVQSQPVTPDY